MLLNVDETSFLDSSWNIGYGRLGGYKPGPEEKRESLHRVEEDLGYFITATLSEEERAVASNFIRPELRIFFSDYAKQAWGSWDTFRNSHISVGVLYKFNDLQQISLEGVRKFPGSGKVPDEASYARIVSEGNDMEIYSVIVHNRLDHAQILQVEKVNGYITSATVTDWNKKEVNPSRELRRALPWINVDRVLIPDTESRRFFCETIRQLVFYNTLPGGL